jgi:transposase
MAVPIQSPTNYKVHSIIRFLNAKVEYPAEIHNQIVAVYGYVMNLQIVMKWCPEFCEGRTDVHDERRKVRPSLITDELLQKIEGEIKTNQCRTIRELHHIILEVSKTTYNL